MPRVLYDLADVPEARNKRRFKNKHRQTCAVCGGSRSLNSFTETKNSTEILDTCGRCRKAIKDLEIKKETVRIVMNILGDDTDGNS